MKWFVCSILFTSLLFAQSTNNNTFESISAELSSAVSELEEINSSISTVQSIISSILNDINAFADKAYPDHWSVLKKLKQAKETAETTVAGLEDQLESLIVPPISIPNTTLPPSGPVVTPNPPSTPSNPIVPFNPAPSDPAPPYSDDYGPDCGY